MAKLDFPGSPTPSQKYPSPAVAGQPVYTWDGEKWASIASTYIPGTAPFEPAMAYSGMQINGSMEVSQERGTSGTITSMDFICDGWRFVFGGTMSIGGYQQALTVFSGFPNHLHVNVGGAQASMGATDYVQVIQAIEGYRIARLAWGTANAQPISLAFWSSHNRTGLYSGVIGNNASTRTYPFTYTQAVANVAQYNVIAIPGDTAGVWEIGNLGGIYLRFALAMGSTYIAPSANTWLAGNYAAAPGQVNAVAATSDVFRITGVTVLPGTQAPTAAQSPNVMRPYDQELVACQRYFRWIPFNILHQAWAASEAVGHSVFWPPMRATPTMSALAVDPNVTGASINSIANSVGATTPYGGLMTATSGAVGSLQVTGWRVSADARL